MPPTTLSESGARVLHLALPKGRMQEGVVALLADAGIRLSTSARGYRPRISLPDVETKILKPQNIVEMLHAGSRDLGFAGADWAAELNANLVEVLDTGLDRVRVVAAAPASVLVGGKLPDRALVVASEYELLARRWIENRGRGDRFVRSYGATEVFPPEDADCIVDVTASGSTLEANALLVVEELMTSSTRLFASRRAWNDSGKRRAIENLAMLLWSVLEARKRVMLELNVSKDRLKPVCEALPCMRFPTISPLAGDESFAVKAAVPRDALPSLIPKLKSLGGTDLVISPLSQVVP
jgi:ATP phosphoribosyltransferase